MERVYFLLKGDGPEMSAIREAKANLDEISKKWNAFVSKYKKNGRYYHDNSFIGIQFDFDEEKPEGWIKGQNRNGVYRPGAKKCRAQYDEWKALPRIPFGDWLGRKLGAKEVWIGMRVIWVGFKETKDGLIIFSSPIAENGARYIPVQDHEELTPSRYIELTKK